jgi:hypothetical protein
MVDLMEEQKFNPCFSVVTVVTAPFSNLLPALIRRICQCSTMCCQVLLVGETHVNTG